MRHEKRRTFLREQRKCPVVAKNGRLTRFGMPSTSTNDLAEASNFSANSRKDPTKFVAELDDPSSTTITPPLRERLSVYRKYAGTPFWERGGNPTPKPCRAISS